MKQLFTLLLFSITINLLHAQSFTKGISIGSTNFINGTSAWGDYDNDGDLDLIIIGMPSNVSSTKLYSNNSDGSFTEVLGHNIINVGDGDVEWEDYNNDGKLDLLVSGVDNTSGGFGVSVTKIYKNIGAGSFQELVVDFTNVYQGSVTWVDFNNDGKKDFLVSGRENPDDTGNTIAFYKNLGEDQFEPIEVPFETLSQSDIEWADFDNDGYIDVAIAGYTGSIGLTKIYRNLGDETFEFHQQLTSAMRASIDWGDYNNDGKIDMVISGFSGNEQTLKVYKNNTGSFEEINDPDFVGGENGSTNWIDYDNDGNLDIISSVIGDGVWATRLYHNDGNDNFTLDTNSGLPIDLSNISLIDVDTDGDLDIFFPSTLNSDNETSFYINNSSVSNINPEIPTLNNMEISDSELNMSWQTSVDTQTSELPTYNIFITYEGDTIVTPNSLIRGNRKLVKGGNTQYQLNYILSNAEPGDYTYSVQAVDNSFNASPFASIKSFHINFTPEITGTTSSLTTPEEIPLLITINDLVVEDPDNTFPDDFSLTVLEGESYSVSSNEISPDIDFNGMLSVPVSVNDGTDESDQFTITVEVTKILGINNDFIEKNFSTYPNPIINKLKIDLNSTIEPYQLKIYSSDGSLIYSSIEEIKGDNYSIDLSSFKSGTYILQVTSRNQIGAVIIIKD